MENKISSDKKGFRNKKFNERPKPKTQPKEIAKVNKKFQTNVSEKIITKRRCNKEE